MKNIFCKLEPVDIIAMLLIIGGLYLKFKGADGLVGTLLISVVFYYFGKKGVASFSSEAENKTDDKL